MRRLKTDARVENNCKNLFPTYKRYTTSSFITFRKITPLYSEKETIFHLPTLGFKVIRYNTKFYSCFKVSQQTFAMSDYVSLQAELCYRLLYK
jgi:hypothetical protein